jgi:hypothetical protein
MKIDGAGLRAAHKSEQTEALSRDTGTDPRALLAVDAMRKAIGEIAAYLEFQIQSSGDTELLDRVRTRLDALRTLGSAPR